VTGYIPQPIDYKSDALTTTPPNYHRVYYMQIAFT